jgi:hypothetical protein
VVLTLLTGTQTDDLAVECVADTVGLSVLESDSSDSQIALGRLRQRTRALGHDNRVEALGGSNLGIVAVLLQRDAKDGARLLGSGHVVGVHLQDEVLATLLLLEDFERLGRVSGRNDTVRDLTADDLGRGQVNLVGQGNNVAKARHAVGTTGASIGLGETRLLDTLNVVDHVDLALLLGEGHADGGAGGRDVLEAGSGGVVEGLAQLLDKGPRVEGIEQIDVAGRAAEDLEGQRLVGHGDGRRLLVGVGAIAQGQELIALAGVLLAEEVGDGAVVGRRLLEGLEGVALAALLRDLAVVLELGQQVVVVVGVADDGDAGVVLCGSAQEGDAANVNLLDGLGDGDVDAGDGLGEGVQVADDKVDLVDAVGRQVRVVRVEVAGEYAAVDGRVQCLDAAAEHLGGLCDGRDVLDGEVCLADHLGGAARGQQADTALVQALGQVEQARLVIDGQDCWGAGQ